MKALKFASMVLVLTTVIALGPSRAAVADYGAELVIIFTYQPNTRNVGSVRFETIKLPFKTFASCKKFDAAILDKTVVKFKGEPKGGVTKPKNISTTNPIIRLVTACHEIN